MRSQLLSLTIIAALVFFAFACSYTLTFGSQLRAYYSVGQTLVSMIKFTLGQAPVTAPSRRERSMSGQLRSRDRCVTVCNRPLRSTRRQAI